MGIETEKFIRKPLYVDAVRVSVANFDEIAAWCQGEIESDEVPGQGTKRFIKVRVHNPKNPRQTKAFVGDWLLYTERGYKVYTNKAFHASFDLVTSGPVPVAELEVPQGFLEDHVDIDAEVKQQITESMTEKLGADMVGQAAVPVSEQHPEVAAAGKRVLSRKEQVEMTQDEVRELIQSGDVILAQDLSESQSS